MHHPLIQNANIFSNNHNNPHMKTKSYILLAAVALFTLSLTSCRTTRKAESAATFVKEQRNEMLIPLAQYPTDVAFMNAKTAITLSYNGYSATVKGRLRMRRDEAVQLSFTALGLMEVAVIEFTPERAYFIDRVNKRYAVFDYSEGKANLAGLNFNTVQALFWNRLFIPGEQEVWRHTEDFAISDVGAQHLVEPSRQRTLKCKFYTDAHYKQLQQTNLNLQEYAAIWRYDNFESAGTYAYPTTHDISASYSSHAVGAHIELSSLSTLDTGWQSGIDLSRYKQVELEQLMSLLNMIR